MGNLGFPLVLAPTGGHQGLLGHGEEVRQAGAGQGGRGQGRGTGRRVALEGAGGWGEAAVGATATAASHAGTVVEVRLLSRQADGGASVGDDSRGGHGACAGAELMAGPRVEVGILLGDDGRHFGDRGGGHGDAGSDITVRGHKAGGATFALGVVVRVTFELIITGQSSGVKPQVRGQRLSVVVGAWNDVG